MSENKIEVKAVVSYGGHSVSPNGSVNLTVKSAYSELTKTVSLLQLLNNDVHIKARLAGGKPFEVGSFRIKDIRIDGDGESVIKFNSLVDYVEVNMLNELVTKDLFTVRMAGEIEPEEE